MRASPSRALGSVLPKRGHSDNRFRVHILPTYPAKFQRFAATSLWVALTLLGQPAFSADPQPAQSVPRLESTSQWHPDAGFTSLFNGNNTVGGAAQAIDTSMNDAGTLFLKGKIARKEPLTLLEQAQAKRAGLIAP